MVKMVVKMVVTVLVNGPTMKVNGSTSVVLFCFVLFCARNLYKVTSEATPQVSEWESSYSPTALSPSSASTCMETKKFTHDARTTPMREAACTRQHTLLALPFAG